jgi:hypothetical protein
MRKPLFYFLLLCLPLSLTTEQTVTQDGIPFKFEKGLVMVDAKIKSDTPVYVVLATGTEYSLIDSSNLQKYKLQSSYGTDDVVRGRSLTSRSCSFRKERPAKGV